MSNPDSSPPDDLGRRQRLMSRYAANLQLLHRTLAATPFVDRYALFGGLLLGLTRDGQPLPGDLDADFYYLDIFDREFEQAVPSLVQAGFKPLYRFQANDGEYWEHTFSKDGAKFEFFRCRRAGGGELRYYEFVPMDPPRQHFLRYLDGPLQELTFLDFQWLVAGDVDAGLTMLYGDWRTPDPTWVWHRNPFVLKAEPWRYANQITWQLL